MDEPKEYYLKEFYSLEQLAKQLDVSILTLREYIKNKQLKASKMGRSYIVTRDSVKEYLEKNLV